MSKSFSALKRSHSASSVKHKPNPGSLVERTMRFQEEKQLKIQKIKKQAEEESNLVSPIKSNTRPVIRTKLIDNIWDQDGKLNSQIQQIHPKELNTQTDSFQPETCSSKSNKKYLQNKNIEPIWKRSVPENKTMSPKRSNSTSSKRRAASALSTRTPQNSSFQEFLNRQDKSFNNQHSMATSNYEPTPKRFIDRKSEQLAKNPIHLKNRKPKPPPEEVEEYTFKPDTSLTRNYRTKNSLSCSCVEAHSIVHEIKMKGLKLDIDENDSQKYKFAPEMELTKGMREYAKRNEAAILAAKEKKKKEKIEEIIREEDTEMEKQIHAHKVPERTQKIGYYMNLFKEDD